VSCKLLLSRIIWAVNNSQEYEVGNGSTKNRGLTSDSHYVTSELEILESAISYFRVFLEQIEEKQLVWGIFRTA
jgi:hypothetical protein